MEGETRARVYHGVLRVQMTCLAQTMLVSLKEKEARMNKRDHQVSYIALLLFFLISVFSSAALAEKDSYAAQVKEAERLGRLLFEKDRAASVATDFILDNYNLLDDGRVAGWIAERLGDDEYKVSFLGARDNQLFVYYSVTVRKGKIRRRSATAYEDGSPAGEKLEAMFKARTIAAEAKFDLCSDRYNTVVLENADRSFFVYLLAATTDPDKLMVGGHYRMHIDAVSRRIIEQKQFSTSCFAVPKQHGALAVMVSHVLAPHPEETHVFVSLLYGVQLYVATIDNNVLWKVNGADIEFMEFMEN